MRTQFGDRMWAANPDDVVRYAYLQRHCAALPSDRNRPVDATITVDFPSLPTQIEDGELTFLVTFADDPGPGAGAGAGWSRECLSGRRAADTLYLQGAGRRDY